MRQGTVDIGVGGMSCASCVASLEGALGRVPGVADVSVNLATERATITYDADATSVPTLAQAVDDAGYQVRTETVTLPIHGMTCAACVNTLERGLRKANGVLSATVNLATERGTVTYLPAVVDPQRLREVVEDLGYKVTEATGPVEDFEQKAREQELATLRRKFVVGTTLSSLVMVGSMPELVPWWPAILTNHFMLWALTTPVQFWVGWQFLRGFGKALRHGTADTGLATRPLRWASGGVSLARVRGRHTGMPGVLDRHPQLGFQLGYPGVQAWHLGPQRDDEGILFWVQSPVQGG